MRTGIALSCDAVWPLKLERGVEATISFWTVTTSLFSNSLGLMDGVSKAHSSAFFWFWLLEPGLQIVLFTMTEVLFLFWRNHFFSFLLAVAVVADDDID